MRFVSIRPTFRPAFVVAAVLAAFAVPAHAADHTVLGKKATVKAGATAEDRSVKVSAKEPASPDLLAGDPVAGGGTLTVRVFGATPSAQTFPLPQGADAKGKPLWKGTAAKGFQYKDSGGINGAVTSIKIKKAASGTFTLKLQISGENSPLSLVPPNPGTGLCVLLELAGGETYSVGFTDGAIIKNDAEVFMMKNPLTEQSCLPEASTTTTTLEPTTTTAAPTTTTLATTTTTMPDLCPNNVVDAGEDCDDGNAVPGDGCDADCQLELTPETEPNTTCAMANGPHILGSVDHGVGVAGSIDPAGDVDVHSFIVFATADLSIETFDSSGPRSCSPLSVDTVVDLYDGACTLMATQDQGGIDNCTLIDASNTAQARQVPPGTYFVRVSGSPSGTFDYSMQIRLLSLCGDGTTTGFEECDGGPSCDASCQRIPTCNDGFVDAPETCDDMNNVSGDGCDANCQIEP